jgi:DNA polymerase IIIc chi subunit
MTTKKVIFISVKDVLSKLRRITEIATEHLEKKEPLLILVPDQAALEFVDELLWKLPEDGFLPHPSSLLQIATEPHDAAALFNLKPSAFLGKNSFKTIYELEDYTSSERLQLSKQRYAAYKAAEYPISTK